MLVLYQYFFISTFAASTPLQDEGDRAIILNKLIKNSKSKNLETDRDMHETWNNFRAKKAEFESIFDAKICTDPDILRQYHEDLEKMVNEVELGWNLKQHQLIDLMDILHHENYTNTGLSTGNDGVNDLCSGLWTYIEKVNETAWDDEKPELETHLQEVIDIRIRIDTHPCPCVWSPWVQWSACTTTCERGLRFRERQIEKDAINNGTECRGPSEEDEVCNADVCCPVNCVWSSWDDWPACPSGCPPQKKIRTRRKEVLAECNGRDCVGEDFEEKSCSKERELEDRIIVLEGELQECSANSDDPPPTSRPTVPSHSTWTSWSTSDRPTPQPELDETPGCLSQCGNKAGRCPEHCGESGYCCKLGEVAEGCRGSDGGSLHHTCVTLHHQSTVEQNHRESPFGCEMISLFSTHRKYVTAFATGEVKANKDTMAMGSWSKWHVDTSVEFEGKENVIALRNAHSNKYITAEANGGANANKLEAGPPEMFELIALPGEKYAFKSVLHSKYLVAENSGQLNANRVQIGSWEKFSVNCF